MDCHLALCLAKAAAFSCQAALSFFSSGGAPLFVHCKAQREVAIDCSVCWRFLFLMGVEGAANSVNFRIIVCFPVIPSLT